MEVRPLGPTDTMDGLKSEARRVPVPATKEGTGRKQGGCAGPSGRGAGRQSDTREPQCAWLMRSTACHAAPAARGLQPREPWPSAGT